MIKIHEDDGACKIEAMAMFYTDQKSATCLVGANKWHFP
jgi:hypothetical protein